MLACPAKLDQPEAFGPPRVGWVAAAITGPFNWGGRGKAQGAKVIGQSMCRAATSAVAGQVPQRVVNSGEATRIMTGAPLPVGSDAVVPIEDTRGDAADRMVQIKTKPPLPGANVMRRGASVNRGERILAAGRLIRPQELGTLAELGKFELLIRRRPRVAVLATGDELVPIDKTPGPGQIRNSNESMLVAQIRRAGADPVPLGISRDVRDDLHKKISDGLSCDMLLLSGGVSAGKLDLVPSELEAAGVRRVFHKVRVKPGKPIWFGVHNPPPSGDSGAEQSRYVFGLPGNPVSSMVCFELFVRTAIRRLMGSHPPEPQPLRAALSKEHIARGDRPTYHPATISYEATGATVSPVAWRGSSDLRATAEADSMVLFPPGEAVYRAGDQVDVYRWD